MHICGERGSILFWCAATITANEGAKSTVVFKVIFIIVSQTLFCLVTCNGCNVSSNQLQLSLTSL